MKEISPKQSAMNRFFLPLLFILFLAIPLPAAGGFFANLGKSSHPWHFDGREFIPGAGDVALLIRDGYLPIIKSAEGLTPSVALSAGQGAIAGFCYLQTSGGKLANHGSFMPTEGFPVRIIGAGGRQWQTTSDPRGFFTLPLPAGSYEIQGTGNPATVTVSAGKTALIALRTGKRMVD